MDEIEIGEIIVDEELEIGEIELDVIKIEPEAEQIEITPTKEEQVEKGFFNTVIVKGDENLVPENIKKDVKIFGVTGNVEPLGEENAIIDGNGLATNTSSDNNYVLNKVLIKVPKINTSGWKSTAYMFYYCQNLTEIPQLDTSNVTNMRCMFSQCQNITSIPKLDTSKVTSMQQMFASCQKLTEIKELDTSSLINATELFNGCRKLVSLPQLNTSKVTNMSKMFSSCWDLPKIPELDTSNVTNMSDCFSQCRAITEIPELDTSNVTNMSAIFMDCDNLIKIPELDASKVTNTSNSFYLQNNVGTKGITTFGGLKNIGQAFTRTSANYSYYKQDYSRQQLLTYESLLNICRGTHDLNLSYDVVNGGTLYAQSMNFGSINKAKLEATEEGLQAIAELIDKGWNVT